MFLSFTADVFSLSVQRDVIQKAWASKDIIATQLQRARRGFIALRGWAEPPMGRYRFLRESAPPSLLTAENKQWPPLGGFKPFLVYRLNHILHRMPVVWALNRRIRIYPALYYFSHQLFCSFSCVVCVFNLQAQFPFRLVYRHNDFLSIIYTIYSASNADCN